MCPSFDHHFTPLNEDQFPEPRNRVDQLFVHFQILIIPLTVGTSVFQLAVSGRDQSWKEKLSRGFRP
jgi:hypothetical protein